jgi:O-antigen/teichoic acid export membrane protein
MMAASVGSGVLMSLVHVFSKFIPDSEYAAFGTLLQLLNWIAIPALGLQPTFAQQTSAATSEAHQRQLVGTVRAVLRGTFCIWLAIALATILWHNRLLAALKLSSPAAIWLMLFAGLLMLWVPIFQGLLQGRQNFLWLGWAAVFNGVGRLGLGALIVFLVTRSATGLMAAILLGQAAALAVGLWQNRDLRTEPSAPFESRAWLRRIVPLSLGYGASQFLFSADLIMVQTHLGSTAPYVFGGTLARAIVLFTAPIVAVMFPKIVHSVTRNQKTDLMLLTLAVTALLGALAAVGLTFTAPLLIRLGSKTEYLSFVPLIPWFAWSMVPLAVANVLLNNLMAHSRFKCVPALLAVAAGYWVALECYHDSFKTVIEVLGTFNLLFLAVCAWFTWGKIRRNK